MEKQEGDVVNEGDVILEMMSDKTSMELEAEESGVLLKIVHGNGATVPVTEVIAYLGAEGETVEVGSTPAPAEVAQATADLKAPGLEVPAAPAAAPQAPKAELALTSTIWLLSVVVLLVTTPLSAVLNWAVKSRSLRNQNLVVPA